MNTYHGKACDKCGHTERYVKRHNCVNCKRQACRDYYYSCKIKKRSSFTRLLARKWS